jgi:hypothetical protein
VTTESEESKKQEKNGAYYELIFNSLREEINNQEERALKVQLAAIPGIPFFTAIGQQFQLYLLILTVPIITAISALTVLYIQHSIMRAGQYMREYAERNLKDDSILGWEEFLEKSGNRQAEAYFLWSLILTFSAYYLIGVGLACYEAFCKRHINEYIIFPFIITYVAIFIFCFFGFRKNFRTNTQAINSRIRR